jgi:hypothetical protein
MTDTTSTHDSWQLVQAADPGYISWILELEQEAVLSEPQP